MISVFIMQFRINDQFLQCFYYAMMTYIMLYYVMTYIMLCCMMTYIMSMCICVCLVEKNVCVCVVEKCVCECGVVRGCVGLCVGGFGLVCGRRDARRAT